MGYVFVRHIQHGTFHDNVLQLQKTARQANNKVETWLKELLLFLNLTPGV